MEGENQHDRRGSQIYKLFVHQYLENGSVLMFISLIVYNCGKTKTLSFLKENFASIVVSFFREPYLILTFCLMGHSKVLLKGPQDTFCQMDFK